ncbi:MarR family transcriptional regulator [Caballeronia sp. SEWSISQ10-4 2]|uniref:DNA-binding protein n=1 Tax=Caballeronia sp. SEWSISQ10-4 2 TaxID=2937438 RepID=UPI0026554860|nr:DNA-binding protein [Caballeronia sp. SEWSISQ10-4 2]MDN7179051.1 MarR family transcriptional regulator [Caballeronia sp. SEWSISQ10-4 2]
MSEIEQAARRAVQLYAESRPRPSQVTMTQAGEMLGITRHTVSKMVKAGQMKLNRCGLIPVEQVDRMLETV